MSQRLRPDIEDRAVSIAKHWGHEVVDDRHVFLAIAAELSLAVPDDAESILAPRGVAVSPPTIGEGASSIIERCTPRDQAVEAFADLASNVGIAIQTIASDGEQPEARETTAELGVSQEAPKERTVEEVLAELDNLVGLASIKSAVAQLVHLHRLNQERESRGLPTMQAGMNLVFTGSPGTGKTSIARIVAELYRALGLLRNGHLVEVQRLISWLGTWVRLPSR